MSMANPGSTTEHQRPPPLEAIRHKLKSLKHSHDGRAATVGSTLPATNSEQQLFDRQSAHSSASSLNSASGVSRFPSTAEGYDLKEVCGKGSSSKVYRAVVKHSGEVVAVKLIDLEVYSSDQHMDLVLHEASALKRQQNPHIVELHAAFVSDQFLWMVLPFVSGGSLETLLKNGHPKGLREVEIATVMKEALEGLAYLHSRGVMHRDIKASNILVGREGSVRLADLGVAVKLERQLSGSDQSYGHLQRRNTFVGSPAYIAPELLVGVDGYGLPADIYSFAVTVVEVAVGHTPYCDLTFEEIAIKKVNRPRVPILSVDSHGKRLSPNLGDLVAACLQPDPDNRPSAAQLLKHKFFKLAARDPKHVIQSLWKAIPDTQCDCTPANADHHLDDKSIHGIVKDISVHGPIDLCPEGFHATHASAMLKRLLLHGLQKPVSADTECAPMAEVLRMCGQESIIPWLLATAISMCKGIYLGLAEMRGLGLQHVHGTGFLMGRIMGDDGLPVWSGPTYMEIASARAGVGAGRIKLEIVHILANDTALQKFKDSRYVLGSELPLTEIQADMRVDSLKDFMQKAQEDNSRPYVLVLRSREGTFFNIMRMLGCALVDHEANKRIYGKTVLPGDILAGNVPPPSAFIFKGFTQLVDDLHDIENLAKASEPPLLQSATQRSESSNRRAFPAYTSPRGFHRFGSGSNRGSRQDISSVQPDS